MDYRICGLFVLFCFGAQSAAAQTTNSTNTTTATETTAASGSAVNVTKKPSSTVIPDPKATGTSPTTSPTTVITTTPKPANCSIGACTGDECNNATHASTYTYNNCASGKCVTEKQANGTITFRCANLLEQCEKDCCDTDGCNTYAAYKQNHGSDASTISAQFHLLSFGLILLKLILM